jgi:hypothetical protein
MGMRFDGLIKITHVQVRAPWAYLCLLYACGILTAVDINNLLSADLKCGQRICVF